MGCECSTPAPNQALSDEPSELNDGPSRDRRRVVPREFDGVDGTSWSPNRATNKLAELESKRSAHLYHDGMRFAGIPKINIDDDSRLGESNPESLLGKIEAEKQRTGHSYHEGMREYQSRTSLNNSSDELDIRPRKLSPMELKFRHDLEREKREKEERLLWMKLETQQRIMEEANKTNLDTQQQIIQEIESLKSQREELHRTFVPNDNRVFRAPRRMDSEPRMSRPHLRENANINISSRGAFNFYLPGANVPLVQMLEMHQVAYIPIAVASATVSEAQNLAQCSVSTLEDFGNGVVSVVTGVPMSTDSLDDIMERRQIKASKDEQDEVSIAHGGFASRESDGRRSSGSSSRSISPNGTDTDSLFDTAIHSPSPTQPWSPMMNGASSSGSLSASFSASLSASFSPSSTVCSTPLGASLDHDDAPLGASLDHNDAPLGTSLDDQDTSSGALNLFDVELKGLDCDVDERPEDSDPIPNAPNVTAPGPSPMSDPLVVSATNGPVDVSVTPGSDDVLAAADEKASNEPLEAFDAEASTGPSGCSGSDKEEVLTQPLPSPLPSPLPLPLSVDVVASIPSQSSLVFEDPLEGSSVALPVIGDSGVTDVAADAAGNPTDVPFSSHSEGNENHFEASSSAASPPSVPGPEPDAPFSSLTPLEDALVVDIRDPTMVPLTPNDGLDEVAGAVGDVVIADVGEDVAEDEEESEEVSDTESLCSSVWRDIHVHDHDHDHERDES